MKMALQRAMPLPARRSLGSGLSLHLRHLLPAALLVLLAAPALAFSTGGLAKPLLRAPGVCGARRPPRQILGRMQENPWEKGERGSAYRNRDVIIGTKEGTSTRPRVVG
mmetsp:Transcript_38967/g.92005  ORF Transcript_38967/g.92005 Transcript_38967/m.92005 type:complete len:109 (+) Transcript_38967:120-446(+)